MSVFIALALALFFGITTSFAAEQAEVSQARHGVIAADKKSGILKYDPDGNVIWSFNAAPVHRIQQLANGNYLICHEVECRVSEYNSSGKIVWEYRVPMFGKKPARGHGPEAWGNQVFNAIRLPNDNTLIATGNGHSVLEVTPAKKIVWHLKQNDLPGITLAWVTSLELLPSGNIIIGNCHAGADNPQLIDVSRNKQVVWTFKDFKNLGNDTAASATVGVRGKVIR
ncbi:MAG: hypothetical protein ACI92G_001409 [Candidatus Pelagisphaera sp.]|jgi:hypothetical protein